MFGLYVDRGSLLKRVLNLLPSGGPVSELVVVEESIDGTRVTIHLTTEGKAADLGYQVRRLVFPSDGVPAKSYTYPSAKVADVEGQDRDGDVLDVELYHGVTTFPLHPLTKSESFRKAKSREVQIYPTLSGTMRKTSRGELIEDPVLYWLDRVRERSGLGYEDLGVALPLWGLPVETARAELAAYVGSCLRLGVPRVRFWSAKHMLPDARSSDLDDEVRAFLLEDLPRLLEEQGDTVLRRLAKLEMWASKLDPGFWK